MTRTRFTAAGTLARVTLIAGTLLAPCVLCAPAFAAEDGTTPEVAVKYGDLNLATNQGAQTLYRRITAAAYEVCWPQDHGDLTGEIKLHVCIHEATGRAVARINNPALTALYEHRPLPSALATVPAIRK